MSTAQELTYHGLVSGHTDGTQPRLQLFTSGGTLREAPLDRAQLVRIIRAAAGALDYLDRQEQRR